MLHDSAREKLTPSWYIRCIVLRLYELSRMREYHLRSQNMLYAERDLRSPFLVLEEDSEDYC